MKTSIVFFRSPQSNFNGEYYKDVVNAFVSGGFSVDSVDVLSDSDDIVFKRRIEEFKDRVDNLIVVGGDDVSFDFKDILVKCMDTALIENENAKRFLEAVKTADGVDYPDSYAYLPIEGTVIPNIYGPFQGFMLDSNEFTVAVLPSGYREIKLMTDKYVIPYLENKFGLKRKKLTLKYFGDVNALKKTLSEAENIGVGGFTWSVTEKNGDVTADLIFDGDEGSFVKGEVIRYVVSAHKDDIYAEYDTTLGERLFDILKLKKLRLSVAESFTGGRVVSSVIQNPGASEFVFEGAVTYSNESKMQRLGVSGEDLTRHGAVSSVVAYQMAAGLLKSGNCDVAIATTGIAGPKSDDTAKPVGLCYIAVGMKDGVHTYRFNLSGSREQITETAKNTALFLAIKNLKNV